MATDVNGYMRHIHNSVMVLKLINQPIRGDIGIFSGLGVTSPTYLGAATYVAFWENVVSDFMDSTCWNNNY